MKKSDTPGKFAAFLVIFSVPWAFWVILYSYLQDQSLSQFMLTALFAFPSMYIWFTWLLRWQNPDAAVFIKITGWILSIAWMTFMAFVFMNMAVPLARYWNFVAIGFCVLGLFCEMWDRLQENTNSFS